MLLEYQHIIAEFSGLSRWKELSKETSRKILPCGDGSCWKTFKPIASLIHAFREKRHQLEDIQELLRKLLKDLQIVSEELAEYINLPNWNCPAFYDDDDDNDEESFTPLRDTKSELPLVEDLNLTQSESKDLSDNESECDVPVCDDFTTFSNLLFDSYDDSTFSDDESFFDEDVSKEIYSKPLFDEEIISTKIDPHHFNAESDLIESLRNRDTLIISSPKFDSLLEEFFGELAHIDLIPPGINEADFGPEEEIRLVEKSFHRRPPPPPLENFSGEPQKHSSHPDLLDPPHHSPPCAATTPKVTTSAALSTHRRHPFRPRLQPAPPLQNHHHHLVSRRTTTTSSSPPPSSPRHNYTNATTKATAPSRVRLVLKHHQSALVFAPAGCIWLVS
nr:hypothetical protein [Tanacetum cinerariifolium]